MSDTLAPPVRDTIPPGLRLIPIPPGTDSRCRYHPGTSAANLLRHIQSLLRTYNARISRLSLTERASSSLTTLHLSQHLDGTITLIHHDSPSWATTVSPSLPKAIPSIGMGLYHRPLHPSTRQELRAYFLRKGGTRAEAWRRFPPSDSTEAAQMERDLATARARIRDPSAALARSAKRRGVSLEIVKQEADMIANLLEELKI